jgi:hypothetical protein
MSLPVPPDYLAKALQDECRVKDITLTRRRVGDLALPTGRLVACDPFVFPEAEPFFLPLPRGTFPIILSIAQIATDQRVAYATVRFRQSIPVTWDMMTVGDQDTSTLKEDEFFGYPVDAGTGCFMDHSTGRLLNERMKQEDTFFETLIAEMDKTYQHTWSWLDMRFGESNLIAFSSGYGDGMYATYAGFDADGEVSVVVTDFRVIPVETSAA